MKRAIRLLLAVLVAGVIVGIAESRPAKWFNSGDKPVAVRGRVTHAGRPLANASVTLDGQGNMRGAEAVLDGAGRFAVALPMPGDYLLTIGASAALTSTSRSVTLEAGLNDLSIDLPPSVISVSLKLPSDTAPELVQLVLLGPSSDSGMERVGFVTSQDGWKALYRGVGFGRYTLTAFASSSGQAPALTSAEPASFALSQQSPVAEIELRLVSRQLELHVQDERGRLIDYAEAQALRSELPRLGTGRFDASGIAHGQEVLVTAPGLLPVCVLVERAGVQVVSLPPRASGALTIVVENGPGRPVGLLDGLPGSSCWVPILKLDPDWAAVGPSKVSFTVRGLPSGPYRYKAAPETDEVTLRLPGPPISYRIPATCRFCGR